MFQPVDASAFVVDREKRCDGRRLPQSRRQVINLIKALDVSLIEKKTARLYRSKQTARVGVGQAPLKTDDKQLAYLLFQGEMDVPHEGRLRESLSNYSAFFFSSASNRSASSGVM